MVKIGLALSGGGQKGFAHLGLLQAMDELGICPYAISGVSSGAVVGSLYAAGYKPEKILEFMKVNSYFGWSNFLFNGEGFFSMTPLLNSLKEKILTDSFENLLIPLFITATDMSKNKSVVFSKGKLFQVIIASSTVPVIFQPVRIGNSLYVDGGLLNNFPVEPLQKICDKVIGSYVNHIQIGKNPTEHFTKMQILERCFDIATCRAAYSKKKYCDVFIDSLLGRFDMFDTKHADMIYEIGYKTALKQKKKLLELLKND
jgi:NTE family protein